jgi:ubiquinol-cytochrome c reductase cytochrome c1 subunit
MFNVVKKICLLAVVGMMSLQGVLGNSAVVPPQVAWPHKKGPYDRAALQRGYQVYQEVCAVCHSLNLVHYRDLKGIGFSAKEIKALASQHEMIDGISPDGQSIVKRKAKPSDHFVAPYYSEQAARDSNNGSLPVDLSLITKARAHGQDYVFALLTGYHKPPQGFKVPDGMNYNAYFPGHLIAMPPPLTEGQVTYADGTPASVDQMAKDVVTFLAWSADPHMEKRKNMGIKVMIFLAFLTGLLFFVKRRVWSSLKDKKQG